MSYEIRVYVDYGYYAYEVDSIERALSHAETIMSHRTYRHQVPGGVEVIPCYKVKVVGPGMESEYNDEFRRT